MTGPGGAGGFHGRRHRAGPPSGLARNGDHRVGGTDAGASRGDAAPRGDDASRDVGAPTRGGSPGDTEPMVAKAGDRRGDVDRAGSARPPNRTEHPVRAFFRANPQVFVLLVICLVLGLGTFIVVLIGLVTAGSEQTTGEPSGAILGAHWLAALFS